MKDLKLTSEMYHQQCQNPQHGVQMLKVPANSSMRMAALAQLARYLDCLLHPQSNPITLQQGEKHSEKKILVDKST